MAAAQTSISSDFKLLGRANPTDIKTFTVGMPPRDFEGLDAELTAVSDVTNPKYGQWLTKEQVWAYMQPEAATRQAAFKWATSTGAKCTEQMTAWRCYGTVRQVETLLSTELGLYMHKDSGKYIVRASKEASVPENLVGIVNVVTGVTQFPAPHLGVRRPIEIVKAGAVDYSIVPSTLRHQYNVPSSQTGSAANTQAAVEFQGYPAPTQTDMDKFFTSIGEKPYTIPKSQIIGPYNPQEGADESTLDVQYLGAMGVGNNNWYWTETDWLYEFGNDLASQTPLPAVLSISYAWYELDNCNISPGVKPCQGATNETAGSVAFVTAVNQLFAAAVARGTTMLSASGDSGAHGRTDPSCTGKPTRADFPAASPYVTSVGATELAAGVTGKAPEPICAGTLQCALSGYEIVASNKVLSFFSSGGGFSNVAAQPAWQADVVNKYIKNATAVPAAADFNAKGRGFPDVAALGHNYYIQMGGVNHVDGTSASTPTMAGMIALLNAWRLSKGQPVLGYINPLLYKAYATDPSAFNDVVQGDNTCTESACPCPANTGFYAAPGWDATSGLGTINFVKLQGVIAQLTGMPEI